MEPKDGEEGKKEREGNKGERIRKDKNGKEGKLMEKERKRGWRESEREMEKGK